MLADVTEGLELFVPSYDATDDPREAKDPFLGVSAATDFFWTGTDGFLNKPFVEGRLVKSRGAAILEADLGIAVSEACLSGLGVRDRATGTALGGGIPYIDARGCLAGVVFAEGV